MLPFYYLVEAFCRNAAGSEGSVEAKAPAESVPGASDTEQAAEQQPLSRKARDGSGYGSGYPGERGLGVEGSPHHRQYGSQKPDPVAPADLEP